ncbi:flagellar assembly factor FliW [Natranaerovirga hydrolytica]|uniref:Flagellar assembly factor FliW n=1 Tax=Natranaerovirga hydrolytica TaxID=680378 RepID=A0A4V2Q0E4_9FIRM|nr:flagellar assembly protein FliW [Natranaerovirga hydrolytica]TCK93381.1 flagellar assembly factor FliW [Natranaerovirga hydrolytica]
MNIQTKHFGEVQISEDKIIHFPYGLLGLTEYKDFTVLYDNESEEPIISWLQSTEDKDFALPIINPITFFSEYAPMVEDELLKEMGELNEDNFLIFNVIVIPEEVEKMTVNLKAPIIVNLDTKKARQVIVDNEDYNARYPLYEHLKKIKEKAKVGE